VHESTLPCSARNSLPRGARSRAEWPRHRDTFCFLCEPAGRPASPNTLVGAQAVAGRARAHHQPRSLDGAVACVAGASLQPTGNRIPVQPQGALDGCRVRPADGQWNTAGGSALRMPSRVGGGVRLRKSAEFREEEPLQTRLEQPQPGIPCCERRGDTRQVHR